MGYLEQVNHSQRARDTPLKVWFLAEKDGTVIAASSLWSIVWQDCVKLVLMLVQCERKLSQKFKSCENRPILQIKIEKETYL